MMAGNIHHLPGTHHINVPLPVEATVLEGVPAIWAPTLHRILGVQTGELYLLSHIVVIQEPVPPAAAKVKFMRPPDTMEATTMEPLVGAMAPPDTMKAVTLRTLVQIQGNTAHQGTVILQPLLPKPKKSIWRGFTGIWIT